MEFIKWWIIEFKIVKFFIIGIVFDYYIDLEIKKFELWIKMVFKFELDFEFLL